MYIFINSFKSYLQVVFLRYYVNDHCASYIKKVNHNDLQKKKEMYRSKNLGG